MRSARPQALLLTFILAGLNFSTAPAQFAASLDIGEPGVRGSTTTNGPASYTIIGGGTDIWGSSDQFHFAYADQTGDFDVRVRVQSLEQANRWSKAGLMARETLNANSRHAFNRVTPPRPGDFANDSRFAYKTGVTSADQGGFEEGTGAPSFPNAWLRLRRTGAFVVAYRSVDGANWVRQGVQDTSTWEGGALPAALKLGLAVTSHDNAITARAEFRDYSPTLASAIQPIVITQQPASTNAQPGQRVTFSVGVNDPFQFQWLKNGAPIAGARGQSYQTGPLTLADNNSVYTVAVSNPLNSVTSSNAVLLVAEPVFSPNFLKVELYHTIGGEAVATLLASPKFPDQPDRVLFWREFGPFGAGNNYGDAYGARISGFILPPKTGRYKFYLRSDDASELYLSTNEDPANKRKIAEETECCAPFFNLEGSLSSVSITLTNGQRYYIEALWKDGFNEDYLQVAWRIPGEDLNNDLGLKPIPGAYLGTFANPAGASILITQPPQDVTVGANETATFTVAATVHPAPAYIQWLKNGATIAGASGRAYTTPVLKLADTGAKYRAQISVVGSNVFSAEATLTVTADTKPPEILSVVGSSIFTNVTVMFSEPVSSTTAARATNYALSDGLTVSSATLKGSNTVVLLTSRQTPGSVYAVAVNNVADTTGNVIPRGAQKSFTAWVLLRGVCLHKFWDNIFFPDFVELETDSRFPDQPTFTATESAFEYPAFPVTEAGNNYGNQLQALLLPPVTGNYVFYTSGDDVVDVYLSTDENPANKRLIASEPEWNNAREWIEGENQVSRGTPPKNISRPIALVADRKYYLEALHVEGSGGDSVGVTWQLPGSPPPKNGDPPISSQYLAIYVNPDTVELQITRQPESVTLAANRPVTLSVRAAGTSTIGTNIVYQWQRAPAGTAVFVDLPGANGPDYFIPYVPASENASSYRALVSLSGRSLTSAVAALTVTPDVTPPTVKCVLGANATTVVVDFHEPVEAATGIASANYALSGGLIVNSATLSANGARVTLKTSGLTINNRFTLTLNNIKDTANNIIAANTRRTFLAQNYSGNLDSLRLLPTTGSLPAGVLTARGFKGRISAAGTSLPNTLARTEAQLAGILIDPTTEAPYGNIASVNGFVETGVINYNQDDGGSGGRFTPDNLFPGFPTATGNTDGVALEILTYVELPAGIHRWGVNSDDGFSLQFSPGLSANDPASITLAQFDGGRNADDFIFDFAVCEDGLYPFRLVFEEGGGASSLEWWRLNDVGADPTANPARTLINGHDTVRAFQPSSVIPIQLSVVRQSANVILSWSGNGTLQVADDVIGPWQDVPGASNPQTVASAASRKFYRVRQ